MLRGGIRNRFVLGFGLSLRRLVDVVCAVSLCGLVWLLDVVRLLTYAVCVLMIRCLMIPCVGLW